MSTGTLDDDAAMTLESVVSEVGLPDPVMHGLPDPIAPGQANLPFNCHACIKKCKKASEHVCNKVRIVRQKEQCLDELPHKCKTKCDTPCLSEVLSVDNDVSQIHAREMHK